jgi:hypothetical protein
MKYQRYEVIFRTWNTKSAVVLATDEDDAINTAVSQISLDDGEDYEVSDIFIINDGDGDYE